MRYVSLIIFMYACMHACMHACIYVEKEREGDKGGEGGRSTRYASLINDEYVSEVCVILR